MVVALRRVWVVGVVMSVLSACSPPVGSASWCEKMKEKEKGEWTLQEAADFAKHCIIR